MKVLTLASTVRTFMRSREVGLGSYSGLGGIDVHQYRYRRKESDKDLLDDGGGSGGSPLNMEACRLGIVDCNAIL